MRTSPIPSRNRKVAAQKDEILGRESESRVVSVSGGAKNSVEAHLAGHCALCWLVGVPAAPYAPVSPQLSLPASHPQLGALLALEGGGTTVT